MEPTQGTNIAEVEMLLKQRIVCPKCKTCEWTQVYWLLLRPTNIVGQKPEVALTPSHFICTHCHTPLIQSEKPITIGDLERKIHLVG